MLIKSALKPRKSYLREIITSRNSILHEVYLINSLLLFTSSSVSTMSPHPMQGVEYTLSEVVFYFVIHGVKNHVHAEKHACK